MKNLGGWDGQGMLYSWERSAYRILAGKHEGKRLLGRSEHRWNNNIKWISEKQDESMKR
jgi:hypothetical protein